MQAWRYFSQQQVKLAGGSAQFSGEEGAQGNTTFSGRNEAARQPQNRGVGSFAPEDRLISRREAWLGCEIEAPSVVPFFQAVDFLGDLSDADLESRSDNRDYALGIPMPDRRRSRDP